MIVTTENHKGINYFEGVNRTILMHEADGLDSLKCETWYKLAI